MKIREQLHRLELGKNCSDKPDSNKNLIRQKSRTVSALNSIKMNKTKLTRSCALKITLASIRTLNKFIIPGALNLPAWSKLYSNIKG